MEKWIMQLSQQVRGELAILTLDNVRQEGEVKGEGQKGEKVPNQLNETEPTFRLYRLY